MDKQPVELTKKQELNNHITASRKFVRQAKVHVIRKLVREIQLLRDRKGSEETQTKCKRKADRLYSEIPVIKALNVDKVTVYALLNQTQLSVVLQNVNSSLEDRALVRLSNHPAVEKRVAKYREANVNWRLQIPVLLEKTRAKAKLAEKKLAEKQLKVKKGQAKPSCSDDNNSASEEEDNEDEVNSNSEGVNSDSEKRENSDSVEGDSGEAEDSDSGDEEPENSEDENSDKSEGEESDNSDGEDSENSDDSSGFRDSLLSLIKPDAKKSGKKNNKPLLVEGRAEKKKEKLIEQKPKSVKLDLNKSEGTIKVQVIKDWSEFEVETKAEGKREISSTSLHKKQKPKSSFFVGGEDEPKNEPAEHFAVRKEHLVGNRKFRRQGLGGGVQNRHSRGGRSGEFTNYSERKPTPRYYESQSEAFKKASNKFTPAHKKETLAGANKVEASATSTEHLHPSWEAKKRQTLPLQFQGKKTKFDD